MWLFLPGGLLMPSIVPEGKGDPSFTNNGLWMMQVRARAKSHLENFIRDYMEEGTYSEIEATPQMDYNFRFYTTHEALALATAKAILDIDYAKFKPTAERTDEKGKLLYEDGKEYHSVLNSIWSTVCKLGTPGGHYGAYSKTNPLGYKNSAEYYKYYQKPKGGKGRNRHWWQDDYADDFDHTTGSTFLSDGVSSDDIDDWENDLADKDELVIAEAVIDIMRETDLDVGSWFPFMTMTEDRALRAYAEKCLNVQKSDLEPIEQEVVAHYFGEDWYEKVFEANAPEADAPPFDNMDGNIQFSDAVTTQKTTQKPAQRRRKNRRARREGVQRGVNFS